MMWKLAVEHTKRGAAMRPTNDANKGTDEVTNHCV